MKRNISSKWTLPTKIFNFVAAIIPLVPLPAAYRELSADILPIKILVFSLFAAWTLFFLWINYRLKFVSADENNLYVSRLLREKTVPLAEVEDVFLTTIGFAWVGIRFKSETVFGTKIFFMPTLTATFVYSFQRHHPVVEELQNLTKADAIKSSRQ